MRFELSGVDCVTGANLITTLLKYDPCQFKLKDNFSIHTAKIKFREKPNVASTLAYRGTFSLRATVAVTIFFSDHFEVGET